MSVETEDVAVMPLGCSELLLPRSFAASVDVTTARAILWLLARHADRLRKARAYDRAMLHALDEVRVRLLATQDDLTRYASVHGQRGNERAEARRATRASRSPFPVVD